jgi:protein TonB
VIYPARAYENDISGTVQLSCIIDCVGKVSNVKVLRGIGGGCDEEAVRVIRSMPAWKPGRKDMITVNVEVIIEFTYNSKTRRH